MCPQKLLLPHTASFVSILGPSNEFPQHQRQISALPPFLIVADLLQPSSRQGGWCLHQLALMVIPRGPTDWTIGCSLTLLNYCLVFFNFCLFGFAFILNFITCMCVYVSVCVCICWGHMTTFRSLFSSTVWVLGTELRQSCLPRAFLNGSSLVLSPLFLSPTTTSFFSPSLLFLSLFQACCIIPTPAPDFGQTQHSGSRRSLSSSPRVTVCMTTLKGYISVCVPFLTHVNKIRGLVLMNNRR